MGGHPWGRKQRTMTRIYQELSKQKDTKDATRIIQNHEENDGTMLHFSRYSDHVTPGRSGFYRNSQDHCENRLLFAGKVDCSHCPGCVWCIHGHLVAFPREPTSEPLEVFTTQYYIYIYMITYVCTDFSCSRTQ